MGVQLSRGRGRRGNAEINVTPFVDVVLVLLDHLHGDGAAHASGHGRQSSGDDDSADSDA